MLFLKKLVGLIMQCVSSVSFQILIHGEPTKSFQPSRGIRQGDSLSPYLFILCAEGLLCMINHAVSKGSWKGIHMGKDTPILSHLFFF